MVPGTCYNLQVITSSFAHRVEAGGRHLQARLTLVSLRVKVNLDQLYLIRIAIHTKMNHPTVVGFVITNRTCVFDELY